MPNLIGSAANQVSTNGMLGTAAFMDPLTITSLGGGSGGAIVTSDLVLTNTSAGAIAANPSTPGRYCTLPSALTCIKSDNLFSIYNSSEHDYGVKDNTGTVLGWVKSKQGCMIGLADNSTQAGTWIYYGLSKVAITAKYGNSALTLTNLQDVALDSNRTLFLFWSTTLYAVVYDSSTGTWGTTVTVRASVSANAVAGVLSATNQVLVASCDTSTAFQAVTLSITDNAITVNTAASSTLSGTISQLLQLIQVGSSFVTSYSTASTGDSQIRALSVSGVTVTIGSATFLETQATVTNIYASASVVRCVSYTTTTIRCTPFTVSGVTLTIGTASASIPTTMSGSAPRTFLNGNGNIIAQYVNTTLYCTVFKLTGTTEVASTVQVTSQVPYSTGSTAYDYVQVSSNKTLMFIVDTGTNWRCNILTDTSGTASVGTTLTGEAGYQALSPGTSVNNIAKFISSGTGQLISVVNINTSGASPTLIGVYTAITSAIYPGSVSDRYGIRNGRSLINSSTLYVLPISSSTSTAVFGSYINLMDDLLLGGSVTASSVLANTNVSYSYTNRAAIYKIESAA